MAGSAKPYLRTGAHWMICKSDKLCLAGPLQCSALFYLS